MIDTCVTGRGASWMAERTSCSLGSKFISRFSRSPLGKSRLVQFLHKSSNVGLTGLQKGGVKGSTNPGRAHRRGMMRKPRPPGLPALPLRQLERQRQLAVIAGEDQQWAIRLRMQEIELYRRLERGAPEARRVRHHDLAQVRQNRRNVVLLAASS